MSNIVLNSVHKRFPNGAEALTDLSLEVPDGQFMVLVGPSGCGKTTALRLVAGLERPSSGTIQIGDRVVNELPPKSRDIAMVFQSYGLYPHMTVRENLGFGLRLRKVPRKERDRRAEAVARVLGLEDLLERRPGALSGGQRQRVAMGRAMVREPQAFLLDEPLSNLDAKLRVELRAELATLHQRLGRTTIYVTHDQVEAMTLGQQVAVMKDGQLQQVDAPQALYEEPVNVFVAGFIGSPPMNFATAELIRDSGLAVVFGSHRLELPSEFGSGRPALSRYLGKHVIIGIRPSDFAAANGDQAQQQAEMNVDVAVVEALGAETDIVFAAPPLETELVSHRGVWAARVSHQTRSAPGEAICLSVDTSAMYFFDPQTGKAIG